MTVTADNVCEVAAVCRDEWTAQLRAFGSWSLHNDAALVDALADSYGSAALHLQLRCDGILAGLMSAVIVRRFATVAYAPLDRLWARPSIVLAPGQRLAGWLPRVGEYLRGEGIDVLAFASDEDPQVLPVRRMHTHVVRLPARKEDLLRSLDKRNRRAVRLASDAGVTVRHGRPSDLGVFLEMYGEVLRRMGLRRWMRRTHSARYFERLIALDRALLLIAEVQGRPAAGTIVTWDGDTGYYQHNASFDWARASYANHLLLFTAIEHATGLGLTHFDLGGVSTVPSENYFKRGWGSAAPTTFALYRVPLTRRGRVHEAAVRMAFSLMRRLERRSA